MITRSSQTDILVSFTANKPSFRIGIQTEVSANAIIPHYTIIDTLLKPQSFSRLWRNIRLNTFY